MPLLPGGSLFGFIRDINERRENAKIEDVQRNYMGDEEGIIKAIKEIDPNKGEAYKQDYLAKQQALEDRQRKRMQGDFDLMSRAFRGMPQGTDYAKVMDEAAPYFKEQGVSDLSQKAFKSMLLANPQFADTQTDDTYGTVVESRYKPNNVAAGAALVQDGKVIHNQPYGIESVVTGPGQFRTTFDKNTGKFGTPADGETMGPAAQGGLPTTDGPIALTVEALRPHFVAQESGGRYGVRNPETDAAGIGQVMDATGRVLAKRIGLAWRPDLMRADTPAARKYQDAITNAAIQDSIDNGGGTLEGTFSHYYSGSPTAYRNAKGNPRTAKYTQEMLARVRGAGAAGGGGEQGGVRASESGVYVPPNPKANSGPYRAATKEELKAAGYPDGTAAQVGADGKFINLKIPTAAAQKVGKFDYQKAGQSLQMTQTLRAQMGKLLKMPGLSTAVGSVQGRLPGMLLGGDAQDARNALTALRDNVGLQQLMQAKEMSTQGASGFGNLSNAEGVRLEKIFGSLDDTSSDAFIRQNLTEAHTILTKAQERMIWQMQQADAGKDWKVPPVGATRNGYRFTGGAPNNPNNWQRIRGKK